MGFRFVLPLPPFVLHPLTIVDASLEGRRRAGRRVRVRGTGVASFSAKKEYTIPEAGLVRERPRVTTARG